MSLERHELVFAKSKVYIHPTQAKRDNIAGFLTLSRPPNATNLDIILSFAPESQLSNDELKVYQEVDLDEQHSLRTISSMPLSYSTPLIFIYSIQFRKPSPGLWYGSIVINTQDGKKLPIFFFHDDESPLTLQKQKQQNQSFDPFSNGELYWGGVEFLKVLQELINVQKSTLEPSVYLINPESSDLRNFAPQPQEPKEPAFNFGKFLANAKWKVLETVATLSARTKNQVLDLIQDDNETAKEMVNGDFDSARIYLAKWAQQVKEEAEQRTYMLEDQVYARINRELGSSELLTQEEISKTSRRNPISVPEWKGFFDITGRLMLTVEEVKNRIFHGGLHEDIRKEAWLFLLEVYPWDSSSGEREALRNSYVTRYDELKLKWMIDDDKRNTDFWKDQKFRIEKDIHRTDRNLEIFKNPKAKANTKPDPDSREGEDTQEGPNHRESSPETPDEEEFDDEFDIANIRNPHLYIMREILLTYNEYNENLGYVQGMTDLLSPLYVILQDEVLAFWSFAHFMERMERNFLRDQSGMKNQMSTLNKLLQFMLPDLYKHLEKCESNDLFFCFRMLLVWFKREFPLKDVYALWEVLLTDYYSSQYQIFFQLSILSDHERLIVAHCQNFAEVLKYSNQLSMKMKLSPLLIRSELLFLKFKRMVDIIDRDASIKALHTEPYDNAPEDTVGSELRQLLRKELVIQKEVERPEGVGGG